MESIEIIELKKHIRKQIPKNRESHTEGVMKTARQLAERYGADADKAEFAALCHDMYRNRLKMSHGRIAAEVLSQRHGVVDIDVLNAIAFHTTARPKMSLLEKIIYVSDAIEPNRKFPEVAKLRELAFLDIDEACLFIIEGTMDYLSDKGCKIHENTLMAREDFLAKRKERR